MRICREVNMARLKKIVPSILTEEPKALEAMIREAEGFTDYVQFDIMDGRFVPSRSITYQDLMAIPIKFSWEAHLMVELPEDYLNNFKEAGAKKVVFHYEAKSSALSFISRARGLGLEVGLAVNPETEVPTFLPLADEVDSVLFLTVHPGFYGSQFIPKVLDKVVKLRESRPAIEIGVDGGIKEANVVQVARTGVDRLYVGSDIFLQQNPAEKYHTLVALVSGHNESGL